MRPQNVFALPSVFRDDGYSSIIVEGIAAPIAWKTLSQTHFALSSKCKTLADFFNHYRLQDLEVLFDFCPLKAVAGLNSLRSARAKKLQSRGRHADYPAPPVQIPSMRNYRAGLPPQARRRNVDSGQGAAPGQWESTLSSVFAYVSR